MRAALVLTFVLACGGSTPKSPEPAAGSLLDCAKVADHVAKTVDAARPRTGVTHEAIDQLVLTRCKADGWSDDTKQCLVAIATIAEGRACTDKMPEEQRTALHAAARDLRKEGPVETDDHGSDWIRHVVEEPSK